MFVLHAAVRSGLGLSALAGLATGGLAADSGAGSLPPGPAAPSPARSSWSTPEINAPSDDPWWSAVRYGRDLIVKSASLIGPEVADPTRRFAGNNLTCENCHLEAGTKKFGNPFQGVFADFPTYGGRAGRVGTIEDRVEGCMTRSMNGKPLPRDSAEMTAIVAYLKFLSTGRPVGAPTEGRGSGRMPELARAADPVRGGVVFAQACAACHGADGQGQRVGRVGDAQGYVAPPLWGPDSFNDGAGMARLSNAANFVHSNMPNGTSFEQPALSPEDAWDVAAFVEFNRGRTWRVSTATFPTDWRSRSTRPTALTPTGSCKNSTNSAPSPPFAPRSRS